MATALLASGLKIARIFGITIRVHASWLLIFFLLVWSLAAHFLPMADLADGGPWWRGAERAREYQREHPGATDLEAFGALRNWPTWHYWVLGAVGTLGLFVCVLAHELSHSLVARANGIPVEGITLFVFGGVSRLKDEARTPEVELKVALVGPLTSIVIAAAFGALYFGFGDWFAEQARALLFYFAFVNGMLAAFNLLPGFPLDGGRVLRAALWKWRGNLRRATATAASIGRGLGAVMIGLGVLMFLMTWAIGPLWLVFIGMFMRHAAQTSYQQVAIREALSGLAVRDILQEEVIWVEPDLTLERLVDEYFFRYRFRSFPVLEEGWLVGMISLKDVQGVPRAEWPGTPVREVLHRVREENLVRPDDSLVDAFRKMMDEDTGHLPVVEGDRLCGIVTRHDMMNLIQIKTDLAEAGAAGRNGS
ncbi:MAG TPA: site-2 protease family protein [Phycisphaerae bacterium]|nr:site-2 protease family protein [Phycisphaerae bacterium]HUX15600.1 site-2 protease family protein [Phycisphaerae bacterium]